MGSVGPIRRTRQKSNLLYPKGLSSLPSSYTSIPVSGIGSRTAQHVQSTKVHPFSSSGGKQLYSSETKRNMSKMSAEFENDMTPSSSFSQIPLRSSEMASKILEQLEKLTPPKEKSSELKLLSMRNNSPMKLSPSMLHGPALRSLEDVDSSKYLENVEEIRSNDAKDAKDLSSQKNDKVEESSSLKFKVPNDKSISTGDGVGSSSVPTKDVVSSSGLQVSFLSPSSRTKCAFQMSAHEVCGFYFPVYTMINTVVFQSLIYPCSCIRVYLRGWSILISASSFSIFKCVKLLFNHQTSFDFCPNFSFFLFFAHP